MDPRINTIGPFDAGEDLSKGQAVKLSSGEVVACDTAGEEPVGIVEHGYDEDDPDVYIVISGPTKALSEDSNLEAGDEFEIDSSGEAVALTGTSGNYAVGRVTADARDASGDGEVALVDCVLDLLHREQA